MGTSWSYSEYLAGKDQPSEKWETNVEKVCRCESHYLFCWGHEKHCDYYDKDKK